MECFRNHNDINAFDRRARHASTDGLTQWFVGTTAAGRRLKVVFVVHDDQTFVKTAYPASGAVEAAYASAISGERRD